MPRYYFDVRDGEHVTSDDEGTELRSIESACIEAAQSASELAKDRFPSRLGHGDQQMMVDIRDEHGPILRMSVTFQTELLR